ncbi:Predicted flavoprotein CzcO associated with the cation diffusion facilitator CzcD [Burkholderia sp. OK233]|nr:Predicted flavoprotein CzcO associated with the cation diffusion facilitator CzcD [Burkholderia sp. OK233]
MSESNPDYKISTILETLEATLKRGDTESAIQLFEPDCYWRDLVAFTWNIKTMEGRDQIAEMLSAQLGAVRPSKLKLAENETATEADGVVQGWITFETEVARGQGLIRLKNGRIWTLLTTMSELKGHEEPLGVRRPLGAEHGARRGRSSWKDNRESELESLGRSEQPYCLIVGGGQGGLGLGARLRQLGVPTIIIDKNPKPGDTWRNRYKTLCLHDPVWYDHMPYLPFPDNWPVFTPKDKIGDWLEMYAQVMELNYWGATTCRTARYDDIAGEWIVEVERAGEKITLRPKQLVLATGMSGKPNIPKFKGMDVFRGEQQHSSQHPGPDAYHGKKVVVIGANNSAHDICAALWEAGVDVTMVQRSSTHIVKSDSLRELATGDLYSERAIAAGMSTAKADMTFASVPYALLPQFQIPIFDAIKERDAEFYNRLEKSGFMLDFGEDGSGLFLKYLRRGSGYYIDVGASELVADGKIKLKTGVNVVELKAHSVALSDGTELEADVLVYATGYGSMNVWAADLISQEVADKVGKVWGLGSSTTNDPGPWEGELRNMWKPTQQEALWFHGGNLHQSRHYSQYLSLQIKARMEGLDTPVFGLQEVHHAS